MQRPNLLLFFLVIISLMINMMKAFKFLTLLIGFGLFFSCKQNDIRRAGSYFPLSVGNYWHLGQSITYEVTKTEELKGKSYYLVRTSYDSTWYRVSKGKVYAVRGHDKTGDEAVIFNLTAKEEDSWTFHNYTVTLQSKKEEIDFQGKKIKNCYLFFVNDPRMADEGYWIWLAPEIGFIQYRYLLVSSQPISTLRKAKINGVEL